LGVVDVEKNSVAVNFEPITYSDNRDLGENTGKPLIDEGTTFLKNGYFS